MPSARHELLVDMLRERPQVLLGLLRGVVDLSLPDTVALATTTTTLADLAPPEYRADLVLVARSRRASKPRMAIVVEIQLRVVARKRWSWPLHMAGFRARLKCPVLLVVVTLDARVARWARTPIVLDGIASCVAPVVIGPAQVPVVSASETAKREPDLAMLSLLAHVRSGAGLAIARAVLDACGGLDDERSVLYTDFAYYLVGRSALGELGETMDIEHYEFRSEFMRRLFGKSIAEARDKFIEEGREKGVAEGRDQGIAEAILLLLETRGLEVPADVRRVITATRDHDRLASWLASAVTVTDARRLLDP